MVTYRQWLKTWSATPAGRVWRRNLDYDRTSGNLPAAVLRRFVGALSSTLSKGMSPDSQVDPIRDAIAATPGQFHLQGSRTPIARESYCRIVDATTFHDYNVVGWELDDQRAQRLWTYLEAALEQRKGEMKTDNDFFWCTTRRALYDIETNCDPTELANEVRDVLGLALIPEGGNYLLRIDIPEDRLTTARVQGPTTLDAEPPGKPFVPFAPYHDPAGHGWTRHLRTLQRGAPEVVIEKLPFGPDYQVVKIGRAGQSPEVDPAAFHAVLVGERAARRRGAGSTRTSAASNKKAAPKKKMKPAGTATMTIRKKTAKKVIGAPVQPGASKTKRRHDQ